MADEKLTYEVAVEMRKAIAEWDIMLRQTADENKRIELLAQKAKEFSSAWGVSLAYVSEKMKALETEFQAVGGTRTPAMSLARQIPTTASPLLGATLSEKEQAKNLKEIAKLDAYITKEKEKQAKLDAAAVVMSEQEAKVDAVQLTSQQKLLALTNARQEAVAKMVMQQAQPLQAIAGQGYLTQLQQLPGVFNKIRAATGASNEEINKAITQIYPALGSAGKSVTDKLNQQFKGFGGIVADTFGNMKNIIQTAFGTFTAMMMFQAQQAVGQFFTNALQKARDFEKNVRELRLAEKLMSQDGIEITNKQLDEMAKKISTTFRGIDINIATDIVGQVAVVAKNIEGINAKQIDMLSQSVAYLKSAYGDTVDIGTILNAVMDRNDKSLTKMGITFSEDTIAAKALNMQLAETTAELTDADKFAATLQILFEQSAANAEDLKKSLAGTPEGLRIDALQKESEMLVKVGAELIKLETFWIRMKITMMSFFDALKGGTSIITFFADNWRMLFYVIMGLIGAAIVELKAFMDLVQLLSEGKWDTKSMDAWFKKANENMMMMQRGIAADVFGDSTGANAVRVRKFLGMNEPAPYVVPETPTGIKDMSLIGGEDGIKDEEAKKDKLLSMFNDLMESLTALGRKARETQEDFDLLWSTDPSRLGRKIQDYLRDQFLINRDVNKKIADANADHRRSEVDAEAKFQEKMRQLREKYLFDLEDALRERDARQVIRLAKQYGMDKRAAINEHELQQNQTDQQFIDSIKAIEDERKQRLADLKYSFELEQKRAAENHAIEMERLEQDKQDRLLKFKDALKEEFDMTSASADAMLAYLSTIYGEDGAIGALMDYTYEKVRQNAEDTYNELLKYAGLYAKIAADMTPEGTPQAPRKIYKDPTPPPKGMPKPDEAFGLGGGLPAALRGGMQNLARRGASEMMGSNVNLHIQVDLSKDLEGRIVNKSLDGMSNIISQVRKARQ
jgi:hypothetical protein